MATGTIEHSMNMIPVVTEDNNICTFISGGYYQKGNTVFVDVLFEKLSATSGSGSKLLKGFPNAGTQNEACLIGICYSDFSISPAAFRIWTNGLYPNINHPAGKYHVYGMYQIS